jgi:hypothetical protein
MFKTAPSGAVWAFSLFPLFEFVSGFGLRISDFQAPQFGDASKVHTGAAVGWFLGCGPGNG